MHIKNLKEKRAVLDLMKKRCIINYSNNRTLNLKGSTMLPKQIDLSVANGLDYSALNKVSYLVNRCHYFIAKTKKNTKQKV